MHTALPYPDLGEATGQMCTHASEGRSEVYGSNANPLSCVLIQCQVMIMNLKVCCCSGVAVCKAGRRQEQQPGTAAAAVPPHRGGRLRAAQARERGLQAPPEAHAHARPGQARHHPRDHAAPLVRFRALRPKMPWGEAAPPEQRLVSAQISKRDPV